MRHEYSLVHAPFHEHDEYAVKTVPWHDDGTVEVTLHHSLIALHVEAGYFIALTIGWRMAIEALLLKDGIHILAES
jgi:hypothetical protein